MTEAERNEILDSLWTKGVKLENMRRDLCSALVPYDSIAVLTPGTEQMLEKLEKIAKETVSAVCEYKTLWMGLREDILKNTDEYKERWAVETKRNLDKWLKEELKDIGKKE